MASIRSTPPASIKTAFQGYCNVLKQTKERQARWNGTTKAFILDTLSGLAAELRPLQAITEESPRNLDTVCLGFKPMPTNIVLSRGNAIKGLVRFGGYLFYSQVFNGKVLIGISYLYVEELQVQPANESLGLLDPDEITEEKIIGHVERFLTELTRAESSPSEELELERRRPFGFAAWNVELP